MVRNRWRALALLACTQFMLILDTAIINVAAPSIGDELGISPAGLSWVANAYLITFGGLLLFSGRAADLFGRRRLFVLGLAVLVAASLAGALAGDAGWLIAARAAQGVGAALAAASAFALLLTLFADGPDRHKALGIFAAMAGAGGAAGTVLGGVLTSWLGWRSTFALNVVAGLLLIALAVRMLPEARQEGGQRSFDLAGALTVTAGLGLLAYALVGAGEAGWTAAATLVPAALAAALLVAFVVIESRVAAPLVPLKVFARPTLRLANVLGGLSQMALFPMFFLVSLYMQAVLEFSPVAGGLGLLPLSLVVVVVAGSTDRLIGRFGLRPVMTAGFALVAAGLAWLARLTADGSFTGDVLLPSLVLGVGLPLVAVTTNVAATMDADGHETGLASGLINTSQQFGAVLGLAVLSGVASARTEAVGGPKEAALTAGFQAAFWVAAAVSAAAALLSLALRERTNVNQPQLAAN
ncbi:MFS transporter [Streptomyces sp. NPDC053048]|uniref:MFS transporter n=1 Tax=Streptomyces sp. NPDC053048 TaxID=3365694 RepID=UPI0037D8629D